MAGLFNSLMTLTRMGVEGYDAYDRMKRDTPTTSQKVDAVFNVGILTLEVVYSMIPGKSFSDFKFASGCKALEGLLRMIKVPYSLQARIDSADGAEGEEQEIVEKMFGDFTGVMRALAEQKRDTEEAYIHMTPEELASITKPIYEHDGDSLVQIGEKSVDVEESTQIVDGCNSLISILKVVEVSLKAGLATKGHQFITSLRQSMEQREEQHVVAEEPHEFLNLGNRRSIPVELRNDPVLSEYKCPITQEPIRFAVRDRRVPHTLYEKEAIEQWVNHAHNNPLTREVMDLEDIIPVADVQQTINARLTNLSQRLNQALQTIMQQQEQQAAGQA